MDRSCDSSSCDSSRATTQTKTHRTDTAPFYARTTTAEATNNNNNNTDITKALHDAMSIPKLTVVRQALLHELVEHSCTTSTTTMNYDYAATFYNQLLMQTQTIDEHHNDNCLDQRDDSAVLDGAAVSSPLPLPLPSILPSTLPSPLSVSSSSSSSLSYVEDNNEEEQGITCVYQESDHNENELSSYLGESDNDNNNNKNNEEEGEGEGDNSVDKGIDWEVLDPDPYDYKDDEEEDDNDEEWDNVAVESICQD